MKLVFVAYDSKIKNINSRTAWATMKPMETQISLRVIADTTWLSLLSSMKVPSSNKVYLALALSVGMKSGDLHSG